jgi:4-hydroxythreonine-4-phosphate dehydrogenase
MMTKVIVSCGDPNGIGLEVFHKALQKDFSDSIQFTLVSHIETVRKYFDLMKLDSEFSGNQVKIGNNLVDLIDINFPTEVKFGKVTKSAGLLAGGSIEHALDLVIKREYDALLTLPVNKFSLYEAGWQFPGHTEMLAHTCKVDNQMMMLCSGGVRVALATVHIPISDVPQKMDIGSLIQQIETLSTSIYKDFGKFNGKIAVLGLNPHAGENGSMGKEEIEIISPAIENAQQLGINVEGPFPADGFFAHGGYKNYDGILAMYHDQGLIPLKLIAKGAGVNYTIGLPIIRISPDHGTAFEIAGEGKADEKSTLEAIRLALEIAENRVSFYKQQPHIDPNIV